MSHLVKHSLNFFLLTVTLLYNKKFYHVKYLIDSIIHDYKLTKHYWKPSSGFSGIQDSERNDQRSDPACMTFEDINIIMRAHVVC